MNKIAFGLALAYVFILPAEVMVESPVLGSGARIIGLVLAIAWLGAVLVTRRIRRPGLFHLVFLLFVVWNGVSIFWSADGVRTAEHASTWTQLLLMSLILWDLCTSRERIWAALQMYVLGCYVIILGTVANFLANRTFYTGRFSAQNIQPDDLGVVLALAIPVACYVAVSRDSRWAPALRRPLNYAFIPLALFTIALSGTRTALVASVPGLVFCLFSLVRMTLQMRIATLLVLIVGILVLLPVVPDASIARLDTTAAELTRGDLNGRVSLWRQGLASVAQHPLLGVGSDMFRSVNLEGKLAHNSFLSVLVENGMIGLALFATILLIVLASTFSLPGSARFAWLVILLTWAIGAFALTWEYKKQTWLFFSLLIAAASISRAHAEREAIEPRPTVEATSTLSPPKLRKGYGD